MSTLKLTNSNYYSTKANQQYISVSQYKDFFGTLGMKGCEACAMAKLRGKYEQESTTALLVGSYVDSYFEGTLAGFKSRHPEILKKDGTLKADYIQAENIIKRIEKDKKFMQFMSGEKQTIMTAELFGAMWKIKMDSYIPDKAIVDLKIIDDIYKKYYHKDTGALTFIQERGYDFQLAIYQKVVELNTGKRLPCYIAVADKGKTPNIEIVQILQGELDGCLVGTDYGVKRIQELKSQPLLEGSDTAAEPERCGRCDYCKSTKVINRPILMSEILEG